MNTRDIRAYLFDISEAIGQIQKFTANCTLRDYERNAMMRAAVERQFEIIGEALNKAVKEDRNVTATIPDHRKIINFRNVLIHGYASVSDDIVWAFVEYEIEPLQAAITDLLDNQDT